MLTRSPSEWTLCWMSVVPGDAGFALRLHHVRDEGSTDFLDIYEFQPVEEDDEFRRRSLGRWVPGCSERAGGCFGHGRSPDRWVSAGVIQDEYADLRKR